MPSLLRIPWISRGWTPAMDFLRGRTWEGLLHSDQVLLFKGAAMAFYVVEHKIQIKYLDILSPLCVKC